MKAVRRFAALTAVYMVSVFFCVFGAQSAYAYEAVCARIPVNCYEFSELEDLEYRIRIEAETFGAPVPEKDILEISEDGTGYFDISITEPGTFRYKVYEIAGDDINISYDEKNYAVTVYVERTDGEKLVHSVVAGNLDGSKSSKIEFRNASVNGKGANRDISDDNNTVTTTVTDTAAGTTAATVTTTAAVTTSAAKAEKAPIKKIVDSVLTGDSFPAHTVRAVMAVAGLAAVYTFLFRRKDSGEEGKNDD
ncbi:MAG: hypothetical protein IKW96_02480 [Ruminococcus sp.]|uniref:Spy0128 family protein n=1 Tax=Ruminococcus sp. TaxID=41978 RepID=UPI0025F5B4E5|nr:FctA domain-containing protein [Ruminococcus sp.]MBR5682138.1 hypothetical protein [Ruminococcus sp.]